MRDARNLIYWRRRGGVARAYVDLRSLGGKREPLVAAGERGATSDPVIALELARQRVKAHLGARRHQVMHGIRQRGELAPFARDHLIAKTQAGRVTEKWLVMSEVNLRRAVEYFGASRFLDEITVADVRAFTEWLRNQPNRRGATLHDGTVRHCLNVLSNLYRRAASEGLVPAGYNPVAALLEKPVGRREEARWLEVHEAALLLEAARTCPYNRANELPFAHALLATFLLTGGRKSEVLGLEVEDVSFDRRTVTFRPNAWRRLKTATSHRSVPLWPQLEEILRPYVFGADAPPGRLLFPSLCTGREAMVRELCKLMDRVARRAGWSRGEIRSKVFRHTYAAARLQTLDAGAPVSIYTVGRELGHGGESMVRRVYGHLGQVRHRADVVEYRIAQHRDRLDDAQCAVLERLLREV